MSTVPFPERPTGLGEKLTIVALFAGLLAVGASLFKNIFSTKKKSKEK